MRTFRNNILGFKNHKSKVLMYFREDLIWMVFIPWNAKNSPLL